MTDQFTLDAAQATPVIIKTKAEDGTVTEHHFEVLVFSKHRYDAFSKHGKRARELRDKAEKRGSSTAEEELGIAAAMAAALDERVHSTNGPVTITSLWDDGLIGLEHLRILGERLNEEAVGNPPA